METPVNGRVKPEPLIKSETSNRNGIVKPEPSDASFISHLPSRDAVEPTQTFRPDLSEESDDAEPNKTDYLELLCNNETLETLETAVSVATDFLGELQDALGTCTTPEVERWIQAVIGLRERTTSTRTIVGVVGNTGAGKSSVINALLDEERLLPTNCLRACTASPVEISFNYSDNPQELYRSEIEFISIEEWISELHVLFNEILDGSDKISREVYKTDSDAGIAYAKVKAVYPHKTKEMLARANRKDLANEPAIRGILGTTKILTAETAEELYHKMQHFVDSKEKPTGPVSKKAANVSMEYWPLIKVVRIFTKANALSTGAVVVDLPGVQDSNVARAAVAVNYMKSCTGLWIVAPITRAVDNKTAKTLLGDSFKRQLKYDGTYSAVSFICSKTDDISVTEATQNLGLQAKNSESWDSAEEKAKTERSLQYQISILKGTKAELGQQLDECEANTDLWEDLETQISTGETVYSPLYSKKRHRGARALASRKDLKSDVDDDRYGYDSGSSDKENSQSEQSRKPLTKEEIERKISFLREQRKEIRKEMRLLDSQIVELSLKIDEVKAERDIILADVKATCIQGRNDYARGAIKQDFAMGIKELDQENAAEEDDEIFDPDQDDRDYDEVARRLPVFCVSSRAYQKLSGKLEKDDFQSHGFLSVEDTEIPKLQEHAKKLTEARRASYCHCFLNELSQLVNSMKLWLADGDNVSSLTVSEKSQAEQKLNKLLGHLEEELESSLKQFIALIRAALQEDIFDNIHESTPSAIEAAPDTASSWGAPRDEGGLLWATYRATVLRQGVYSGASGPRDFNQELFNPISRSLATGWERAFQRRLPSILDAFVKEVVDKLKNFHQTAKAGAEQHKTNFTRIVTLYSQMLTHSRTVQALSRAVNEKITEFQRNASRRFTTVICNAMTHAYDTCVSQHGAGSYARMKEAMVNHVGTARHSMFDDATKAVKQELEAMCRSVMEDIGKSIEDIFNTMCMEYKHTYVGTGAGQSTKMTYQERNMRRRVNEILRGSNKVFARVLDEPTDEVSHEPAIVGKEAQGANGTKPENDNDLDEMIQTNIREQDSAGEAEDDTFSSDEEVSGVMGVIKKKQQS